jgi:hypothetical protein
MGLVGYTSASTGTVRKTKEKGNGDEEQDGSECQPRQYLVQFYLTIILYSALFLPEDVT